MKYLQILTEEIHSVVVATLNEEGRPETRVIDSRCLSCGRSVVDPNKCIGCGICTTKCEFDAIHLRRNRPQNSKMIPAEDKFKAIAPYAAKRQVKIIKKQLSGK